MTEKPKKERLKPSSIWIVGTDGKPSISATFATVAFTATTIAYVASIFESIGSFSFRSFDATACTTYLVPILTLYFSRKWADTKVNQNEQK